MMNALAEFFSPEAGQARRQWLNRQEDRVGNALAGYLGPAAQPIQSAALLAGYLSPGADMMEAADASRGMWNADNPMDAAVAGATMLGATGMMFLPGNFNALQEGVGSVADDLVRAYDPNRVNAIIAYHGSPHTFDRFDISKIGTGEGAQAYGHGLYFAENEAVARGYRDALATVTHVNGTPLDDLAAEARSVAPALGDWGTYNLRAIRPGQVSDESIVAAYIGDFVDPQRAISHMWEDDQLSAAELAQRWLREGRLKEHGSLYQVQINADPSQLLDWDAPLSAQPGPVREALAGFGITHDDAAARAYDDALLAQLFDNSTTPLPRQPSDPTGGAIYGSQRLVPGEYRVPPTASRNLLESGIPGIQYLDAGSRSAGQGSRNFVIFDDSIVDILKRYGIGAAAVGGGWALAPEEAQAAQSAGLFDPAANDRQVILDWLNSEGL